MWVLNMYERKKVTIMNIISSIRLFCLGLRGWCVLRFCLFALLFLVGCSGGDSGDVVLGHSRAIRISASIDMPAVTMAPSGAGSVLLGARFLQLDAASAPLSMVGAKVFTGDRAAGGAITFSPVVPVYNTNNYDAYFVAYHPGVDPLSGVVTWPIDGATDLLVTPVWSAGNYALPVDGSGDPKLTFKHQLCQLEVILQAANDGTAYDLIKTAWGNITSVELLSTAPDAVYTYSTNSVTYSGTPVSKALLGGDYQSAFVPIALPANGNLVVNAAGMYAPSVGAIGLRIKTVNVPGGKDIVVPLTNGGVNTDFIKGNKHVLTLSFSVDAIAPTSAITPWSTASVPIDELVPRVAAL